MLAVSTSPMTLGLAAFLGMVNGMGRDRGAALVVEQSVLPATVTDSQRTLAFAQYNVLQDIGHAAGSLLAAAPALFQRFTTLDAAPVAAGVDLRLRGVVVVAVPGLSAALGSNRSRRAAHACR